MKQKRKPFIKYNLTGKRFGRLLVINLDHTKNGQTYWKCECDCGKISITNGRSMRLGTTKSCGCFQKEKVAENKRKSPGESSFNRLLRIYKKNAENRKLEFLLNKDDFKFLTQQNCYYCGSVPKKIVVNGNSNGDYVYNGIDRIDNLKGYTIENCVSCCETCNKAKLKMSQKDFFDWVLRIYNYSIEKKLFNVYDMNF